MRLRFRRDSNPRQRARMKRFFSGLIGPQWSSPLACLGAHCQHGPPPRLSYHCQRCQPRLGYPARAQSPSKYTSAVLTRCLPFLAVFSVAPRSLLSEYPDQPLLLPPSLLGHCMLGKRGASLRHVVNDATTTVNSSSFQH